MNQTEPARIIKNGSGSNGSITTINNNNNNNNNNSYNNIAEDDNSLTTQTQQNNAIDNATLTILNEEEKSTCRKLITIFVKLFLRLSRFANKSYSYEIIREIVDFLKKRTKYKPKFGIICGSGLSHLAEILTRTDSFEYESIPHFPVSTVVGHVGRMVFGLLGKVPVMCMQGRFHYYEGYPLTKCSMPIRVMKLMGVSHLLATNAAGGVNPEFNVGDIMIVKDHINFLGFAGNNPLQGPNDPRFGPRFPPMTKAYDRTLQTLAKIVAKSMGIDHMVREGVYTCLGGPNYETVAELRMLKTLGIDAVGMSTVHEVITARHCEMTVFAFSLITNKCALDYETTEDNANHAEVVAVGKNREKLCGDFMCKLVAAINGFKPPTKPIEKN